MIKVLNDITEKDLNIECPFNIKTTHTEYDKNVDKWKTNRDVVAGEDAVKAEGERYLKKLSGHDKNDYDAYKWRASFYDATYRTKQAYSGMVYRKSPTLTFSDNTTMDDHKAFLDRISYDGKDYINFLRDITDEIIVVNRVGVLVDFPTKDSFGDVKNYLEFEKKGIASFASIYKAEAITNWHFEEINSKQELTMVILKETSNSFDDDDITITTNDNYRVLYLEEYEDKGRIAYRYKQMLYEGDDDVFTLSKVFYPRLPDGNYFPYIPFDIIDEQGNATEVKKSMISGLVSVNLKHYGNSADYENEVHWVGIKTAVFTGLEENAVIKLGKAVILPENATAKILEPTAGSAILDAMTKKEEQMAVLGSQRIAQQGKYVASAVTSDRNSITETSLISNMSKEISTAASKIFTLMMQWNGKKDVAVEVTLNTDYYQDDISGEELVKWTEALQSGSISYDTFFYNLSKKEAYPVGKSKEAELKAMNQDGPWVPESIVEVNSTAEEIVKEEAEPE